MKRVSIVVLLFAVIVARAATAQVLPSGFSEDIVATGLTNPTDFGFLPDGRILIAQKSGLVLVYKNGAILPTPLIDVTSEVNDYWDRGMTAIGVDPDFATNGFVYLWYVYENDPTDYEGPKTVRLTRVTVSGDTASRSTETVILGSISGPSCGGLPVNADCVSADSPSHNGGTIKFAADKTIFITTGDGASFDVIDPLSLRAQDLDSLSGKLLHITRTGQGLASNPFWNGDATAIRSKVYAYGFRNPLRATLKPGSGQPYVADVGLSTYEEIDVATAGANLGWPCYEGPFRQPGFQDFAECQALYNPGDTAVVAPLVWYPHNDISSAVIGGAFYTGTVYPAAFQQAFFFGDYAQGFVNYFHVDANDALTGPVSTFATGEPGPVIFDLGPNGDLYYIDILPGELRHLRYVIGQPATTRELSAVSWTSATNGWGPVERDLSNGEDGTRDGGPITIHGNVYPKGLGVNSPSDIRYQLDGQCTSFASSIGIDDEVGANGSVIFQVWADGVQIYGSSLLKGGMPALSVSLNIAGKQQLDLIVTDGGDGSAFDHADWADATITCGGTSSPQFATAVSMPAGVETHGVSVADLNGDGKLDIVSVSAGSNITSVWLGNGDGTFGARRDFATGAFPKSVAIGDLNKDGRPDLVTANQDGSSISVLLATAGGSFATHVDYPSCIDAHEVAIGDFNRDGSPDVIAACWGGSVVSVFLGRGDGTFGLKTDIATGAAPHSVVVADFDKDGFLDAAIANHDSNDISVLRGRGDGTFFSEVRYAAGQGPHSIRTGDLNGDGILDLVTANEFDNTVTVLLGRAGGTFAPAVAYAVGSVPKGVLLADLDTDGRLDIMSTNTAGNYPTCCFPGGDTVTMLHGNGDGTFTLSGTYTVGTTPFAAAAGDFDRDGRLDVVTANWDSNDVTLLHNIGGLDVAPVITNVAASALKSTSATITWTTNEAADGQVSYGLSASYGSLSPIRTTPVTAHQEVLTGLTPNTLYHYQVMSRDSAGGLSSSGDHTFTTGTGTGTTTYVSDLTWTSMTNGWGPAEKDHSNGENAAGDGHTITLRTVPYTKGLGVHAASELDYALPTGCTQFVSDVGVDDEVAPNGSVIFQVWGDTTLLAQSGLLTGASPTLQISADLTGHSALRLIVTDGGDGNTSDHADWAGARLVCSQQVNTAPVATISSPAANLLFKVADVITYAGSGTDAEDGPLPATSLTWDIILHHCPDSTCHTHPFLNVTGTGGTFTVPDHGEGIFFEFNLTATDSLGLTGTSQRFIYPQTSTVTLNTVPSGLDVVYGGIQVTAPIVVTTVVGSALTILAPSPQGTNSFVSWSDSGAQQHNVVTGSTPTSYTATFNTAVIPTMYISDLTWTSMTNGWGPVEKDRSNGESAAGDGQVITLRGVTYAKGLGTNAASSVSYAIPTGCTQFASDIGVDDEVAPNGSVIFQVWGDGVLLAQSALLTGANATNELTVDLTGRSQLTLDVTDGGDGNAFDHGDWANARLICGASATSPTVTTVSPAAGATAVAVTTNVTATFSEAMTASTLNTTTVTLVPQGSATPVAATVTYVSGTNVVTLQPTASLAASTLYTATIKSGAAGVKDSAGNPLAADKVWTFTTASGGGTTTYVSDLTWTSMTNGWGPVEKDRSNGEAAAGDGKVITLRGATYAKGLGTNAASNVSYAIPSGCTQFASDLGVDDEVAPNGSVIFQVWADGVMLGQSALLTGASAAAHLTVDLTGRSQLSLVVTDGGDGNAFDHGDWANARLSCTTDTTPPTVTTVSPAAGATAVATTTIVTATFSEAITASTLTTSTVTLVPQGSTTKVAATVAYVAGANMVTLQPTAALAANTLYTATIKSGAAGVKDLAGNPLATDKVWTFTTASGGGTTTFVSDLTWTSMTNGWGPVEKDRSNGEAAAGDGKVITLRGVTYTKGLGTNSVSNVTVTIPAGCTQFASDLGIDDEVAPNGSVIFQVWADGVMLAQSALLTGTSAVTQLIVDLTGRSQLSLVVTDGGDGNAFDHGDWANARLICK